MGTPRPGGSDLGVRAERQGIRRSEVVALAQAVAALATHREIVPLSRPTADWNVRNTLGYIVRLWRVPLTYTTAAAVIAERRECEHVVPVRVLVDRIIMEPADTERLLNECVITAHVTGAEHRQLGKLYRDHRDLYEAMLAAPIEEIR